MREIYEYLEKKLGKLYKKSDGYGFYTNDGYYHIRIIGPESEIWIRILYMGANDYRLDFNKIKLNSELDFKNFNELVPLLIHNRKSGVNTISVSDVYNPEIYKYFKSLGFVEEEKNLNIMYPYLIYKVR